MTTTKFNSQKATQIVYRLLEQNGGHMNYMKLIKELYLIDRICLDRFSRTLTGDIYFSMKNGPVLSNVLDKISSPELLDEDDYWQKYLRRRGFYELSTTDNKCPHNELSQRELRVVDDVFKQFQHKNHWEVVDWCHENLPEYEKREQGRAQIFIQDILRALGKTREEIIGIIKEIESVEFAKNAFNNE